VDCYATEEYDNEDLEIGVQAKEEGTSQKPELTVPVDFLANIVIPDAYS
jgi:hypothetical protein